MRNERYATDPEYRNRISIHRVATAAHPETHPCEGFMKVCGKTKTERHHDDDGKPTEIRWLCRSCHMRLHHHLRRLEKQREVGLTHDQ
jgi:hypothetical protein